MKMKNVLLLILFNVWLVFASFGQSTTVTLQPDAIQGKDAYLNSLVSAASSNYGNSALLSARAWTHGGAPKIFRGLLDFDLSSLPPGIAITDARLTLSPYTNPSPLSGSNSITISRIIQAWDENMVTWNNQPTTDLLDQVSVPTSANASVYQDVDVTALIIDRYLNPASNFGMQIQLVTEQWYRAASFCSSDHIDSSLRPKLEITYNIIECSTNLVQNNSFETRTVINNSIIDDFDPGSVPSWGLGWGTPHISTTNSQDGTNNAAMWAYNISPNPSRGEAIVNELLEPTSADELYYFRAFVRARANVLDVIDNYHFVLTNQNFNLQNPNIPNVTGQYIFTGENLVENNNWLEICGFFRADSSYANLLIYPEQNSENGQAWLHVDNIEITPIADAGDNVCLGEEIGPLCIHNNLTYEWSQGGINLNEPANWTPTLPGTYILEISNGGNCSFQDTINVSNTPPIEYPAGVLCANSTSILPLAPNSLGGTWSASCGNCIDANTGEFNPGLANLGANTISYSNTCVESMAILEVFPSYVCCLDTDIINKAFILSGNYQVAPNIPSGSTVIIEDDVVFDNTVINWTNVTVYVEGKSLGGSVNGAAIKLSSTDATFTECTFQSTCDIMWKGIEVEGNSKLHMYNTHVSDAYMGINLLYNSIEEIIIDNCDFTNNYYSIYFQTGEYPFDIQIVNSRFDSDSKDMKKPYNYVNTNNNYYTEAHLYFTQGISRLFPFVFSNNTLNNCKYGIYSEDNYHFGMHIQTSVFNNCFTTAVHAERATTPWGSGNAGTNDLLIDESEFNFANSIPPTLQFTNISQMYGVVQSAGDLEVVNCIFTGSKTQFLVDIGIRFYNPVYNINLSNNNFNTLGTAVQVRAYGGSWLKLNQQGLTQKVSGGTEVTITSNFFHENNEGIRFMSNNNPNNIPPRVTLPPIPDGVQDISPCPNCPEVDMSQINQTIRCNDFIGSVGTAIYVEPYTLMNDIGSIILPAGNEIVDPTYGMNSILAGSININNPGFTYYHYYNENIKNYNYTGISFFQTQLFANANTCLGDAGARIENSVLKDDVQSVLPFSLFPNPTSTGLFNLELGGFEANKTITITDMRGKPVAEYTITENRTSVDLSSYSKGVYLVKISDGINEQIQKVIFE